MYDIRTILFSSSGGEEIMEELKDAVRFPGLGIGMHDAVLVLGVDKVAQAELVVVVFCGGNITLVRAEVETGGVIREILRFARGR